MAGQANVITLSDEVTFDALQDMPENGIRPRWKKYEFMFGDSYSTGGEDISSILATGDGTDFPYGILTVSVDPIIVNSTSHGPYLVQVDLVNQTLLLFYIVQASGVITQVANATDVYTSASDCLKVQVSVFGY